MITQLPIALIEDDIDLSDDLTAYLQSEKIAVIPYLNGEDFLAAYPQQPFSVVILDINLPGKNGYTIAETIRADNETIPILFLSCDDTSQSYIKGMQAGADVYLDKSASMEMILATCKRLQQRGGETAKQQQVWVLDSFTQTLTCPNGKSCKLTNSEADLLLFLGSNTAETISKSALVEKMERDSFASFEVIISRLRKKIAKECTTKLPVRTKYNQGYRWSGTIRILQ